MDFGLQDKVALITGGSRGIGRAVGLTLAAQGVHVAFCGRTRETLDETAEAIRTHGVQAWPFEADVSRLEDIEAFVGEATKAAGRVNILVNNAVTSLHAPFNEQTDDHWRYHIDVKLMAYIRCARAVLPFMREQGGGRIVNIGGMTARIVAPIRVTNGVVNAGVSNFTKQLSYQVAGDNVTVNCIHPGATATERMMASVTRRASDANVDIDTMKAEMAGEIPMGKFIQPEDIASAALFFCSPMADMVTGQCIAVDGGSGMSVNY